MARRIFISYQHDDQMKAKGFNLLRWNKNVPTEFVGRHLLDPVKEQRSGLHNTKNTGTAEGHLSHGGPDRGQDLAERLGRKRGPHEPRKEPPKWGRGNQFEGGCQDTRDPAGLRSGGHRLESRRV